MNPDIRIGNGEPIQPNGIRISRRLLRPPVKQGRGFSTGGDREDREALDREGERVFEFGGQSKSLIGDSASIRFRAISAYSGLSSQRIALRP